MSDTLCGAKTVFQTLRCGMQLVVLKLNGFRNFFFHHPWFSKHSLAKIPYIVVCGKKEVADNTVTVRKLGSEKQEVMKREDLIKNINGYQEVCGN